MASPFGVAVAESWIDPLASMFESLLTGARAAIADERVWVAIVVAVILGGALTLAGACAARMLGLLDEAAPVGEKCGVGLGCGLVMFAAVWATISSGGRTSFAPVAVGLTLPIALHLRNRLSRSRSAGTTAGRSGGFRRIRNVPMVSIGIGAVVVAALGLLYGATLAPSPINGVQPVEFMDEAFYSILGRDLARTGVETIYSPAGFDELPGLPSQTWYHWGEVWLSASVISLFGVEPMLARHYVVLPLLLLASATLTGTLVRRAAGSTSRSAFLFGAAASLVLAPVPLPGPYFAAWARGLVFGITLYGLAAVIVLLGLYVVTVWGQLHPSRALSLFCGALFAAILPSHIVIAFLAAVGVAGAFLIWNVHSLTGRRCLARIPLEWRWMLTSAAVLVVASILWGQLTGHGVSVSGTARGVAPFNGSWQESIVLTAVGSGVMWLIPASWWLARAPTHRAVLAGAGLIIFAGALVWGARFGDFNTFHVLYGGIAVFTTPLGAIAGWLVIRWLRSRLFLVAGVLMFVFVIQLAIGTIAVVGRLQRFGPGDYDPIPLGLLEQVERLPLDAKIAYACGPLEEIGSVWDARLLSIDAHTGRRIIPMCFQAEFFSQLNGVANTDEVISPLFELAPQRALYPHANAQPSPSAVIEFMQFHGIRYIYADTAHPNTLVPDAVQIVGQGQFKLLRIP